MPKNLLSLKKENKSFVPKSEDGFDKLYKTLFKSFLDGIYILDTKSLRIIDANPAICKLYGYSLDEMRKLKVTDISAEEQKTRESIKKRILHIPCRLHKKKDGTEFPVEINASTFKTDGKYYHIVQIRDIAEQLKKEKEIRENERDLREAQQIAKIGNWRYNLETKEYEWSSELNKMTGRNLNDVPASMEEVGELFTPEGLKIRNEAIKNSIKHGLNTSYEAEYVRIDNKKHGWMHTIIKTEKNKSGEVIALFGTTQDITERKLAEIKIKESEESLNEAQQLAKIGNWSWELETGMLKWSEEMYSITGRDKNLKPPSFKETVNFYTSESKIIRDETVKKSIESGENTAYDAELIRFDNQEHRWIHTIIKVVKNDSGKVIKLFGTAQDITGRKILENKLKELNETLEKRVAERTSEMNKKAEELQLILDSVPAFVFYKDNENRIILSNSALEKSLGLKKEDIEGKSLFDLFPSEEAEKYYKDDKEVINKHKAKLGLIESMETPSGIKWLHTDKVPLIDQQGEVTGIIGFSKDITERIKAEEALRESEERFKMVATKSPDHLLVQDMELRYTLVVNPQMGLTETEMLGKTDYDFLSKEDADKLTKIKKEVLKTGKSINIDSPIMNKNGEFEYFEGTYVPRFNKEGEVDGLMGYFKNVTERKLSEAALRKSEERFRSLYSSMTEGMVLHELVYDESKIPVDYRILEANSSFEKITGIKREQAIGKLASELYGIGIPPYFETYANVAQTGIPYEFETEFEPMKKAFRISVFSPEKNKFATVFSDISERKIMEEKINTFLEEVQAKNDELTRFNNVMVGREYRMIELKKEINELCSKLGEPLRYSHEFELTKK